MTSERQLFDKPMDVLREAFVRNRFSEPAVFGIHDIETWLPLGRKSGRPGREWEDFLAREFMAMCAATAPITHLRERATPYEKFPGVQTIERTFPRRPNAQYLLRALHASSLVEGMYYGHARGCIAITILEDGETRSLLLIREGMDGQLMGEHGHSNLPGTARLVIDALFAEWDRQRPKWSEAREFLCNALAEEIKRTREKAEHDFDTAVAVSADGTKIVHADWVVVVPKSLPHPRSEPWVPRRTMTVFPGTALRERKILKSDERMRLEPHYDPYSHRITNAEEAGRAAAEQFAIVMRSPEPSQAFGYLDKGGAGRGGIRDSCFITTADFCPSPLPDGDVEVTV